MANIVRLFNSRHSVKYLLAENTLTTILVYGEITYTERGEVLEEMSTL